MSLAWLARQRRVILLLLAALLVAGWRSLDGLPVALLPPVHFPRLLIEVDAGEQSAERMAVAVTMPLEQALRSLPAVASVRSVTSRGDADISVIMDWSADMDLALLRAQALVASTTAAMPGVSATVRRMDPTVFPCVAVALAGQTLPLDQLRQLAIAQVRPTLAVIPGVANVAVEGGGAPELRVTIDPARAHAHGLTLAAVRDALAGSVVDAVVGRIASPQRMDLVIVQEHPDDPQRLAQVVVSRTAAGVVHLGDVARIVASSTPTWSIVTSDGQPAVSVEIYQQPGGNTVAIAAAVRAQLAALAHQLPPGIALRLWYDQSDLIRAGTTAVLRAVLIGIALAALVVLVALRQLRAALIAAITVPGALAGTALGLHLIGESLNLMTLGGMAAAVGLIIDDAIVVVELLARHLPATEPVTRRAAVLTQARALVAPMVGSTLASLVILLPLATLTGIAGSFFTALAMTMGMGLIVSLLLALTVLPLAMAWWGRPARHAAPAGGGTGGAHEEGGWYTRLLRGLVAWRWLVVASLLPIAAAGILAERDLGTGFLPTVDEGGFTFDYRAPPGTSLERTDQLVRQVEGILCATPEVQTTSRRTGLQLGGGLTEANEGDIFVRLKPLPRASIERVMERIRTQVAAAVPQLEIDLSQQMEDLIGDLVGNPHPIEIELVGQDGAVLQSTARHVAAAIRGVPGIVDVSDGVVVAGNAVEVRLDAAVAAMHGLDAAAVADQLRTAVEGVVVASVTGAVELVGVRAVGPTAPRVDPDALAEVMIVAPDGAHLPLRAIAQLRHVLGQSEIDHHDLQRVVAVTARIDGSDLGAAIDRLRPVLAQPGLVPAGVQVHLGGLYAQQQQAFHDLVGVLLAAIAALVILLTALYRSLRLTVALLITATCSLAGVTIALWLTRTDLTITALMGLTMVVGIVTEVGILFASALVALPAELPLAERVVAAASSRVRPILMTVAAAVLALLPLALAGPGGAELQQPLAIAIIGGLLLQIPLALVVLPMLVLVLRPALEVGDPPPGPSVRTGAPP